MSDPLVSIIVPCYKQAQYLPETLDSVMAQTYSNWECVIVNDGSPDNTEEVAQSYCKKDQRFKYVYRENGGLAAARNTGIRNSKGEFILPLDSDDIILPTFLEKTVNAMINNPNAKLACSDAEHFGAKNDKWPIAEYSYTSLLFSNPFVCTSLFRRKDYDRTNGYNEKMKKGWEDWDFWLQLLSESDTVINIREHLFLYRAKECSMIIDANKREKEICKEIVANHWDKYQPYMQDILYLTRRTNFLEYEVNRLKNTIYYKVGYIIGTPIRLISHLIKKI